jgi:hypothetical protein
MLRPDMRSPQSSQVSRGAALDGEDSSRRAGNFQDDEVSAPCVAHFTAKSASTATTKEATTVTPYRLRKFRTGAIIDTNNQ